MDAVRGRENRHTWSRKDEEYIADFTLVTRRCLTEEEYRIFRFHYLLGADWRLCCRKLGIDRGLFFHSIYRIEQKLGQYFRELEPYPLYPLDEYFNGPWKGVAANTPSNVVPIRGRLAFPRVAEERKIA